MKLLGISGSPRKNRSHTFLLLREVLSAAEKEGGQTEVVHLCDLKIEFCQHCSFQIGPYSGQPDLNWGK